jgi:hypothetical protein
VEPAERQHGETATLHDATYSHTCELKVAPQ